MNWNWHYWSKRIRGKPTCILSSSAKLFISARVRNTFGDSQSIRVGSGSLIKGELLTFGHGGKVIIGSHCYIGEGTRLWSADLIEIGDRTLISHNVNIIDNLTHSMNPQKRHTQFLAISGGNFPEKDFLDEQPIIIGADVLVGCQAIILKGVSIGTGAVIGAGSVVTSDVKAYTIVAGNPAKFIRDLSLEERG